MRNKNKRLITNKADYFQSKWFIVFKIALIEVSLLSKYMDSANDG